MPAGFAHGFYVVSETADVIYKCSDFYAPEEEYGIAWNDPQVGVRWPLAGNQPLLSAKDAAYGLLSNMPMLNLPEFHRSGLSQ